MKKKATKLPQAQSKPLLMDSETGKVYSAAISRNTGVRERANKPIKARQIQILALLSGLTAKTSHNIIQAEIVMRIVIVCL